MLSLIRTPELMKLYQTRILFAGSPHLVVAALVLLLAASCVPNSFAQETGPDPAAEAIALFNEGQDLHEKGKLDEAVSLYEKALKLVPQFPEAEAQRGNALVSLGRRDEAEKAFRKAVELRDDWSLAHASLGSVLVEKGDYSAAEPVLRKAIELDKQNFPAFSALTELKLRTGAEPAELKQLYSAMSELTTGSHVPASVWAARAALEIALGDPSAAKTSLLKALESEPKNRFALAESARLALLENDPQRAGDFVRRLEAFGPTDTSKMIRARLLVAEGKADEAVKVIDSMENRGSEAVKFREAVLVSGSTDQAALERQLAADPKNAAVLGRLCIVLRTKDPKRAIEMCRSASEADPMNISHAIGYAAALVQSKQYEPAVFVLRKLLEIAPDNSTARANLATALFQLGRFDEAKIEYRWLISKQPDLAGAYYLLAITHDKLGEYMDAMANYQQFLRIADPESSKLEIEKVHLRLPILQKQIKGGRGKKNG